MANYVQDLDSAVLKVSANKQTLFLSTKIKMKRLKIKEDSED